MASSEFDPGFRPGQILYLVTYKDKSMQIPILETVEYKGIEIDAESGVGKSYLVFSRVDGVVVAEDESLTSSESLAYIENIEAAMGTVRTLEELPAVLQNAMRRRANA